MEIRNRFARFATTALYEHEKENNGISKTTVCFIDETSDIILDGKSFGGGHGGGVFERDEDHNEKDSPQAVSSIRGNFDHYIDIARAASDGVWHHKPIAKGTRSIAFAPSSIAIGNSAIAIQGESKALAAEAIAIGARSEALARQSIAMNGLMGIFFLTGPANTTEYTTGYQIHQVYKGCYVYAYDPDKKNLDLNVDEETWETTYGRKFQIVDVNLAKNTITLDKTIDATNAVNALKVGIAIGSCNGSWSVSSGYRTKVEAGYGGVVEGSYSLVKGNYYSQHAEGYMCIADGAYAHAEGYNTYAGSSGCHTEGLNGSHCALRSYNWKGDSYAKKANLYRISGGWSASNATLSWWTQWDKGIKIRFSGNIVNSPRRDNTTGELIAPDANPSIRSIYTVVDASYDPVTGNMYVELDEPMDASTVACSEYTAETTVPGYNGMPGGTIGIQGTSASAGSIAHVEGLTTASISGQVSHSEGQCTLSCSNNSHAEGRGTVTLPGSDNSHAEGGYTKTRNPNEHACGQNNVSRGPVSGNTLADRTIFSVGVGIDANGVIGNFDSGRSGTMYEYNAVEIRKNGDMYLNTLNEAESLNKLIGSLLARVNALEDLVSFYKDGADAPDNKFVLEFDDTPRFSEEYWAFISQEGYKKTWVAKAAIAEAKVGDRFIVNGNVIDENGVLVEPCHLIGIISYVKDNVFRGFTETFVSGSSYTE